MVTIIKRDGKRVPFDEKRIRISITKAFSAAHCQDDHYVDWTVKQIVEKCKFEDELHITDVSHITEAVLDSGPYGDVGKCFSDYRRQRDIARELDSSLSKNIRGLIEQSDPSILNENANKDSKVIPTQRDLLAGIVAKHYAVNHILPREVVDAHESGYIHYHDLDYAPFFPMFNCMLIDLKGMFTQGFKMGNADIEEPKSIATAAAVTAQIIAQVASNIYGGTTINRIDEVLEPYVFISHSKWLEVGVEWNVSNPEEFAMEMTEKECFNAFQSLEYEVNTLHTANGQTPFVTFGFGLGESWAAKLIQKSILQNRIAGLGKDGRTAIFPKLTYIIKEGLNRKEGDPNYDIKQLALECASKRMYPDILNYDRVVEVTGSFKTPMGCRSFLHKYELDGIEYHDGRNNLGVVSVNLPRLAIEAKGDWNKFKSGLNDVLALSRTALMTRIDRLKGVTADVAPILYMHGACGIRLKAKDEILDIFKNNRASISLGYIGIHETIKALFGEDMYESTELQEKGLEIVQILKDATSVWSEETGYAFSLYATPSENLCDRFCRLDVEKYGEVVGVNDKGYYTNSFHLDVEKKVNPWDKIDFEKRYPAISSGGFICYGEFPNIRKNVEALENVWDYSYDYVPYYGTNTPIDECYDCGFTGEFDCTSKGFSCPSCGNRNNDTISVTRRICGYLGSPSSRPFNEGKQEEVQRRVKHLKEY